MGTVTSLAVSIGVPLAGGFIGAMVSQKQVLTWYQKLNKPRWTPPNWLFAPAWTVLYITQGTAAWLVYQRKGKGGPRNQPLGLFAGQLLLNFIWQPLFFNSHKTDVATMDAAAMLGVATAATVAMSNATSPAMQLPLMVPYLCWVAYATALSANICAKNPTERLFKTKKQKATEAKGDYAPSLAAEAATAAKTAAKTVSATSETVSSGRGTAVHATRAVDAFTASLKAVLPFSGKGKQAAMPGKDDTGKLAPLAASIRNTVAREALTPPPAGSGSWDVGSKGEMLGGKALDLPTEPVTSPYVL